MKKCFLACSDYKENPDDNLKVQISSNFNLAVSKIDKAVKKGVIHRNAGANQKSRLSKALKSSIENSVS